MLISSKILVLCLESKENCDKNIDTKICNFQLFNGKVVTAENTDQAAHVH